MSSGKRFGGLEGLRTIGVVAVFATHNGFATGTTYGSRWSIGPSGHVFRPASLLGHLEIGPAIFFMISAFLLYRPFVSARFAGAEAPSALAFLRRRAVRVFPAYWLAFGILYAVGQIHADTRFQLLRFLTLTHIYTEQDFFRNPTYVPTWTLATEASFYFFLVAYAALLARVGRDRSVAGRFRCELGGAAVLVVVAVAFRAVVYTLAPTDASTPHWAHVAEHWLPGTLDIFAVGLVLAAVDAYVRSGSAPPRVLVAFARHPDVCALAAVGWYLLVPLTTNASMGIGFSTGWDAHGRNLFQTLCAATLLVPLVLEGDGRGRYRRFVALPFMAYVGTVSYGIYLWHDHWIVRSVQWSGGRVAFDANFWLVGVSAFVLSLACGAASYHWVERPLLDLDARRAAHRSRRQAIGAPA